MSDLVFNKKCPGCKKEYQTTSRRQKFCCPDCGKRYNERLKKNHRFADEHKELLRIKARSHSLATEILKYQFHTEGKEWECQMCFKSTGLEVHHHDRNSLNNTPSNLTVLCTKCHAAEHAKIQDSDFNYNSSYISFIEPILKPKNNEYKK